MDEIIAAVIQGVTAFAATNIDDLFILMFFFSQVDKRFRRRHIIVGQYLGFTVLIALSMIGFLGTLVVPWKWIGLLGIVPIALGLRKLFAQRKPLTTQYSTQYLPTKTPHTTAALIVSSLLSPHTYSVAAVTLANGATISASTYRCLRLVA